MNKKAVQVPISSRNLQNIFFKSHKTQSVPACNTWQWTHFAKLNSSCALSRGFVELLLYSPLTLSPLQAGRALKAAEPVLRGRRTPGVSTGLGSQFQSQVCHCRAARLQTSLFSASSLLRKDKGMSILCKLYFGFYVYKSWTMLLLKEALWMHWTASLSLVSGT